MIKQPELLACRAVHQYRRRDILAYVSLRLFLRSSAAIRDTWIDSLLVEQVMDREKFSYNESKNFKERDKETDDLKFRILHLPAPSEILAEAALLDECSKLEYFKPRKHAYSYHLSEDKFDNHGMYKPYFVGFLERHRAIANACKNEKSSQVVYLDIKSFYPSITLDRARDNWIEASKKSGLDQRYQDVGCALIESYRKQSVQGDANDKLLTGPMFCHLLADLFLRSLDDYMICKYPNGYFRYVDDVALVVGEGELKPAMDDLKQYVERLDLVLNSSKQIIVSSKSWLSAESDFEYEKDLEVSWKTFVGGIKILLLKDPDKLFELKELFENHSIRISPLDYSEISQERPWLDRLNEFKKWIKRKSRRIDLVSILNQAIVLRTRYKSDFFQLIEGFENLGDFDKKRKTYRLKFLVTRLLFIAENEDIEEIADHLSALPEMTMAAAIYRSVITQDVTEILKFGPHAAQSTAQVIKAFSQIVKCDSVDWSQPEICQAYAILRLNGLEVVSVSAPPLSPMIMFCNWTDSSKSLFHESDAYFRELGCLHGVDATDHNSWALNTAFDRDDDMVFDIQSVMNESY